MKRLLPLAGVWLALQTASAPAKAADDFGRVPYAAIEGILRDQVRARVDGVRSGHEGCWSFLCPDADWRLTLTSDVVITQRPQPTLSPLGPSPWIDGFEIAVDAQVKVKVHVDADIVIGGPAKDIDFVTDVEKLIGVHLSARVYLEPQPELEPESIEFMLTDDGGNVRIDGLNGDLTILGMEAGAVGSFLLIGDPITGGLLGAVLGNEAANRAKDKIRAEVQRRASDAIVRTSQGVNTEMRRYVVPEVKRLNSAIGTLASLIGSYT